MFFFSGLTNNYTHKHGRFFKHVQNIPYVSSGHSGANFTFFFSLYTLINEGFVFCLHFFLALVCVCVCSVVKWKGEGSQGQGRFPGCRQNGGHTLVALLLEVVCYIGSCMLFGICMMVVVVAVVFFDNTGGG